MIRIHSSIEEIDIDQWDALLKESRYGGFFQSKQCYDFYQSTGFLKPFVVGVSEDDSLKGIVVGYIQSDGGRLKRFFSRRAIVNAGPLLANDITEAALEILIQRLVQQLKRKAIYVETRNFFSYSQYKELFLKVGFKYLEHLNFQIDTTSEEVVMQNMGRSHKRYIKVALRDGATIIETPTDVEISEYYSILSDLYKTKIKTPLFPINFFRLLNSSNFGKILLVKYNGEIIGGITSVGISNSSFFEWFICGNDKKYKNIHASTLATFAGIQYACNNGYQIFDFMGAGTPNDGGYGVRDFKAQFGGKLVEDGRFLYVLNPILYAVGKQAVKIMKKIRYM